MQVDSLGRFHGDVSQHKPTAGHTLRLSLDVGLQKAGQQALQQSIDSNPPAPAGAFVALNPDSGEVWCGQVIRGEESGQGNSSPIAAENKSPDCVGI